MIRKLFFTLCLLAAPLFVAAQTERADSAFRHGDYGRAATLYAEALKHAPTAQSYYNLGCALYRRQQLPEAVVAFRHALWLSPGDDDARHNLAVIETQLPDRFNAPSQAFFLKWLRAWRLSLSPGVWGLWAFLAFVGAGLLFVLYRYLYLSGRPARYSKSAFSGATLLLLFSITFNVFAWRQVRDARTPVAVVMKPLPLRDGPSATARVLRRVQPGVTLTLTGEARDAASAPAALSVALPDGTSAWLTDTAAISLVKP